MTFTTFRTNLLTVLESLDTTTVKLAIGDSPNNNRSLTVNQLIRYLSTRRASEIRQLGNYLTLLYNEDVRLILANNRYNAGLVRDDAFDVSELTKVLKSYGNQLSRILKSAA